MKAVWRPVILLAVVMIAGCVAYTGNRPIPEGTYYTDAGDEWITISEDEIFFHVRYTTPAVAGSFIDQAYTYWVGGNGQIYMGMSSNDWAYLEYFRNPWFWRGGAILKLDPDTEEETWFRRR